MKWIPVAINMAVFGICAPVFGLWVLLPLVVVYSVGVFQGAASSSD